MSNGIVINSSSLNICSFFRAMAKCEIATGLNVCEHFFSVRSVNDRRWRYRREIESFRWKFAAIYMATRDICICIRAPDTFANPHIFFSLYTYTHWKIHCTMRSDEYRVSFPEDFYLLVSNVSYFCVLWFLSKYLRIIYDGNLDEAVYVYRERKWRANIDISDKPIAKSRFSKFRDTSEALWNMSNLLLRTFKTCVFNMGAFRSLRAISFVI